MEPSRSLKIRGLIIKLLEYTIENTMVMYLHPSAIHAGILDSFEGRKNNVTTEEIIEAMNDLIKEERLTVRFAKPGLRTDSLLVCVFLKSSVYTI